jgi:hypothetical protein
MHVHSRTCQSQPSSAGDFRGLGGGMDESFSGWGPGQFTGEAM